MDRSCLTIDRCIPKERNLFKVGLVPVMTQQQVNNMITANSIPSSLEV